MCEEVKVIVESPVSSAVYALTAEADNVVETTKQFLQSLSPLTQPATSFRLVETAATTAPTAKKGKNDGSAVHQNADIFFKMQLEPQSYTDVQQQMDQLREEFGLAPNQCTYLNAGATRLQDIQMGTKKRKNVNEDSFLGACELPFDLQSASTAITSLKDLVAAEPNPLVPKPSAQQLSFSRWQPLCRDPRTKLQGILAFVVLVSNDGKEWHFVAYPEGYVYVPQLSNLQLVLPGAQQQRHYAPTLVQAIERVSPSTVSVARKSADKAKANILATVPVIQATTTAPWLVKNVAIGDRLAIVSSLEVPSENNLRDWNEDFQITREIDPETIGDRITRDRSMCKTATDFAATATETVCRIVEGAAKPLNPEEEQESQKVYLLNGIFYTSGSDYAQPYVGIRGPEYALKAAKKDLAGVEQLMQVANTKLCPILTSIVDYCGRRIVAQAPVPGIFQESEESLMVYGQTEDLESVRFNEQVDELMQDVAKSLHLKKHPVDKAGTLLQTSLEVHGTHSTDGRTYAIDMYRLQVPDLLSESQELNLIRFEAIEEYFAQNKDAEPLNADAWMDAGNLPGDYIDIFKKDIENVKNVAKFVRETILNNYVDTVSAPSGTDPLDGLQLTNNLHRLGINMRLLGQLYAAAQAAKCDGLSHVAFEEALARCLKVQAREVMAAQSTVAKAAEALEQFFHSLETPEVTKKAEQRLKQHFGFSTLPENWTLYLKNMTLVRSLSLKLGVQWNTEMNLVALNPVCRFALPTSAVAEEALVAGLRSLNSAMSSKTDDNKAEDAKPEDVKTENDKTALPEAAKEDAKEDKEDSKPDNSTQLLESLAIISEACSIVMQIYGSSNIEVARVFHRAAVLFFEYGNDAEKAAEFERRAITIAERVKGVDSYDTVTYYRYLAFFERAADHTLTAIELNRRVIELTRQISWNNSEYAAAFKSIGSMLLNSQKEKLQLESRKWFEVAYNLQSATPAGPSGHLLFELGQANLISGDLDAAINRIEESHKVFLATLGENDSNMQECKKFFDLLTASREKQARLAQMKAGTTPAKSGQAKKNKSRKGKKTSNTDVLPRKDISSVKDVLK